MLPLTIQGFDLFDEASNVFIPVKGQTNILEHSLVSISKWEMKYKKPFLSREPKTREETIDYVRFMTVTQNVNPLLYEHISDKQIEEINRYLDDPMTATTFNKEEGKGGSVRVITSEEIYYYMVSYRIPPEYQKWHFNRLMTLIRICDEMNKPKKKMRNGEIARSNRSLNKARRARSGSRG